MVDEVRVLRLLRAVSDDLARAVGFRTVLVHEYVAVDDAIVVSRLGDLSDLDRFAVAVVGWLPSA